MRHSRWYGAASSALVSRSRAVPTGGRRSKPSPRFLCVSGTRFRLRATKESGGEPPAALRAAVPTGGRRSKPFPRFFVRQRYAVSHPCGRAAPGGPFGPAPAWVPPGAELNRRHKDFQSSIKALPSELPRPRAPATLRARPRGRGSLAQGNGPRALSPSGRPLPPRRPPRRGRAPSELALPPPPSGAHPPRASGGFAPAPARSVRPCTNTRRRSFR